ncbi:hypothetical protein ACS0TY_014574 [Phlomoides rotata]
MAESEMSMKLLIDTCSKRVLFAEAGKDCVDFLFFILSLPLSTLIRLLGKQGMMGSVANLYGSIETLDESYIQPNMSKDSLLNPTAPYPGYSVLLLSSGKTPHLQASSDKIKYRCSALAKIKRSNGETGCYYSYFSNDPSASCPDCGRTMSQSMTCVDPPPQHLVEQQGYSGGFVKEVVTYMVTDDLVVNPMSTISLLKKYNIKNVCALEEKVVNLGVNEAVKLVKASLVSNKVLTHVFLGGKN